VFVVRFLFLRVLSRKESFQCHKRNEGNKIIIKIVLLNEGSDTGFIYIFLLDICIMLIICICIPVLFL